MTREEMLNKLQGIGFAFIDPASDWEDIGFSERMIWVNAAGYGWVACDEPNTFYGNPIFLPRNSMTSSGQIQFFSIKMQ